MLSAALIPTTRFRFFEVLMEQVRARMPTYVMMPICLHRGWPLNLNMLTSGDFRTQERLTGG
ncbi:hypothetical protein PlfCFBP13513_02210 [Plantibacter flavus]|nr:hypothetical protein PlfCFBP13513_02210 [Plantibacter flavus]